MSKTLSYKGTIAIGEEDRIRLTTIKGKVGYQITKFDIISTAPGTSTNEFVAKITKIKDANIGPTVKFTDGNLLAVAYVKDNAGENNTAVNKSIIFDNEKFNQDIFVNISDAAGGTTPCNYYIELETMPLSDLEATMITLKSLRTIEETI
jgi:hypothetical protein